MIKLGALWEKESKIGVPFMSGTITIKGVETKVVCFKNKYKDPHKEEDNNKPDWVIQESEPMTYNNNPRKVVNPNAGRATYDNRAPSVPNAVSYDDDDIPF